MVRKPGTIVTALRDEFERKGVDHSDLPRNMLQRLALRQNAARGDTYEKIVVMALMQAFGLSDLTRHVCFTTPLGRRFVDLYHAEGRVCFEIKSGRVTLTRLIRQQIRKDRHMVEKDQSVDGVIWCLFEGASDPALAALRQAGLQFLDFTNTISSVD